MNPIGVVAITTGVNAVLGAAAAVLANTETVAEFAFTVTASVGVLWTVEMFLMAAATPAAKKEVA